jgi:NhaP-type Na+/H+ or K+/H+ antiporter
MSAGLAVLSLLIVLYGLVAVKLGRWSISMPMVFVAVGILLGPSATNLLPLSLQAEPVKDLTAVALALVLFTNASTLSLRQVERDTRLVLRLLAIGLPLTVALGAAFASGLLSGERLAYAALLGAILAPTDAALDLPIFTSPQIPMRIRRALNVESGLNDGIVTPIVALCLAVVAVTEPHTQPGVWLSTAVLAIALAIMVGVAMGAIGGWLLIQANDRGWTSARPERIVILGLGLTAYLGAVALRGNGFIAAFIAGIVFAAATRNRFVEPTEFTETISTVLSRFVWVIFGALLVPIVIHSTLGWRPIAYAVLSLTVVRMLPIALALLGTGLRLDTVALMGWFGPRGLASVVFTLLAYTELKGAGRPIDVLMTVATWTILLSVLAHGLSAQPLSVWYAHRSKMASEQSAEARDVPG